jgi:lauroyl/myristoyl acyltransferase
MNKQSQFRGRSLRVDLEILYYKFHVKFFGLLEGIFGAGIVAWFMKPLAWVDMLKRKRHFAQFLRLRSALPEKFWQDAPAKEHLWKITRDWQEGCGAMMLYHRLSLPYWQKRFTITGNPPQTLPEWGKRPMVLAFLHTGQFGLIRFWMRAQGVPTAALIAGLPHIAGVISNNLKIGDRRYGLTDVPQTFYASRSLRAAVRFLTPGHVLTIALDGDGSSPHQHTAGEFPIQVKEGACRIAAITHALVIPTSVKRTAPCCFEIRFGRPVPDELMKQKDSSAATQYVISELWKDLENDPEELNWTTLEALAPALKEKRNWWP